MADISLADSTTTCSQKYLTSHGACAPSCSEDFFQDPDTTLCENGESCCYQTASTSGTASWLELQVPIFDYSSVNNIAEYIAQIYKYMLMVLVPIAITMIIIGGVFWTTSAGNASRITTGKKYILNALIGLLMALFSYYIFSLIGIDKLKMPVIESLKAMQGEALFFEKDITSGSSDICSGVKTYDTNDDCKAQEQECQTEGCVQGATQKWCCSKKPSKAIYVHWSAGTTMTNAPAYTFTVTGDGVVHQNYSEENGSKCTWGRNQKGNMCVSGMGAYNFNLECFKKGSLRGEYCNAKGTFTQVQIQALLAKVAELKSKWSIPALTHSQAAIQDGYHCYLTPKDILSATLARRQAAIGATGGCRWDWYPMDEQLN
ncbi:MAG: pilin [Candidatus Parcubacteria bacterium]|nr:pilin [Candidatus Parcubacteria bacterium]